MRVVIHWSIVGHSCTRHGLVLLTELLLPSRVCVICSRVSNSLSLFLIDLWNHCLHLSVILNNLGEPIVFWKFEDFTLWVSLSGMDSGNGVLHFLEEIVDDIWLLLIDRVEPSLANFINNLAHIVSFQFGSMGLSAGYRFLHSLNLFVKLSE